MISAIIIDDEPLGRSMILGSLQTYCPEINIIAECDNIASAKTAISENRPDLIFLDIALPGGDGFDLLKSFDIIDFDVIFVTAHDQYILKALRFNAIDYLLKPIDEDDLVASVKKVKKNRALALEKLNIKNLLDQHFSSALKKVDSLCIPTNKGFQIIKMDEIICCEANNMSTLIHLTGNKQVISTKPLAEYDLILSDSGFTRVHKSWLINMQHIKEYTRGEGGTIVLTNDKPVVLSRRKREHFLSELKKVFRF